MTHKLGSVSILRRLASSLLAAAACAVTTPAIAAAEPAFPDLDTFSPVDVTSYEVEYGKGRGPVIHFATPDGLACEFNSLKDRADPTANQYLNCYGTIPGIATPAPVDDAPPGSCVYTMVSSGSELRYDYARRSTSECGYNARAEGLPLLEAGSKLASGNIVCAVGADSLTACLDTRLGQRHGFVLKPSGSNAF